jgi:nucleotide-binding universal stress UspA family protein
VVAVFEKILVGYVEGAHGAEALALAQSLSYATGAPIELATAEAGGESLAEHARAHAADLIVLGSSHRTRLGRTLPGSTVERLLGDAPCAVAVAPPGFGQPAAGEPHWRPLDGRGEDSGMRVVGAGYDGSPSSQRALTVATELALANRSALRVYTVAGKLTAHTPAGDNPYAEGVPSQSDVLREELHRAVRELPPEVRALPVFARGFEADELLKAAGLGVDLLILGSRPGGPLRRRLQRSITSVVLAKAKCPVLVVPISVAAKVAAYA